MTSDALSVIGHERARSILAHRRVCLVGTDRLRKDGDE